MKKILYILAGVTAGLILIIFINPLIASVFGDTLNVVLPLLLSVFFIEVAMIIIAKRERDDITISFILFQVVNTGFLMIYIIAAVINVVLKSTGGNDLAVLIKQSGYSHNEQLAVMLASAIILFAYTNFLLKRMKKNLPTIIENKNRKTSDAKK
ncbi:MAG: hypothetical protein R6W90_05830 [Ignavibacteriaceae bacterium]